MTFAEARSLLAQLPTLEVKPGLERIERLLEALGHPERAFPVVHVAGTNGKGSVVAMLDSVLRCAGYHVGRYTSPELIDIRERITLDGEWISREALAERVGGLSGHLSVDTDPPTQFEALTALAFSAFAQAKADLAVVEVGLGGRFDATNCARSVLTILTNVAFDHVDILGGTIEKIAWEKAGIVKPGVPLVTGEIPPEAEAVVNHECSDARATRVDSRLFRLARAAAGGLSAEFRLSRPGFPEVVRLPLLGGYQMENLRVALSAIAQLRNLGWKIPADAVSAGLSAVQWPGRFEIVRRSPTFILEGAHNPAGARVLAEDIAALVPDAGNRHLLFGALADKDVDGMLEVLAPVFGHVSLCQSASPRAHDAEQLVEHLGERSEPVAWYDSVGCAIDSIVPLLDVDDVLVVAGSLTVVAEARRRLLEGNENAR